MTDNLWTYISPFAVPAESQIAEGGGPWPADAYWNCVFATVSVALQVYGYPDLEPEDLRQLVQPGTHRGAEFTTVAAYLRAHSERWPNLPSISCYNPNDTLGDFAALLDKGFVVIFDAWDDGNGNLLDHAPPQGYSHAVILEAMGPTIVTVWNPWRGEQAGQNFPRAFIQKATYGATGNLMVFQRSVLPAPAPPKPVPVPPPVVVVPPQPPLVLPDVPVPVFPPATTGEAPHAENWLTALLGFLTRVLSLLWPRPKS